MFIKKWIGIILGSFLTKFCRLCQKKMVITYSKALTFPLYKTFFGDEIQKRGFQTWKNSKMPHKYKNVLQNNFPEIKYNNYWSYSFHEDVLIYQRKLMFKKNIGLGGLIQLNLNTWPTTRWQTNVVCRWSQSNYITFRSSTDKQRDGKEYLADSRRQTDVDILREGLNKTRKIIYCA